MSLSIALEHAYILATERLQPHHVIRIGDVYTVRTGYNAWAIENVFPSAAAYGGNACRNGRCG